MRPLFVVFVLMLAGCQAPTQTIRIPYPVAITVPLELQSCPDSPEVPGEESTQKDVGAYIVDLHQAHSECKSALDTINMIMKAYKESIKAEQDKKLDTKKAM